MEDSTGASNFLRRYLLLHKRTEIPEMFALWCGLSSISACLGRRTWIDMGTYTIFPNLYIVLVGSSGRCRKSTSVNICEDLLRQIEPKLNIVSQRITTEALIDAIRFEDSVNGTNMEIRKKMEAFVLVDELATFLNRKSYDSGLPSLLIQMYDCKSVFEYRTKARGVERMTDTCLGMLGASTIDWIRNALPEDAIGGGLTSRIMFILAEKPPSPVAITTFDPEKTKARDELIRDLRRINQLSGQTILVPDSWNTYEQEYNSFYKNSWFFDDKNLSGYASRRHVHMLKVAMAFAAAEAKDRIVIEPRHIIGAREILEQSEALMPKVIELITSTDKGALIDLVFARVTAHNGRVDRMTLLREISHRVDSKMLQDIIDTLRISGRLHQTVVSGEIFYSVIKRPVAKT